MPTLKNRLEHALAPTYRIDRELGGGGMSRVFLATEHALGRQVVIKVLPPELAAGVNAERFRREIQLAAQLQHPLIVPLLSAGDDDGLLWFAMPFIDGESLRQAIDRRHRLPPREVVRTLHDVVDALAYAHERGIVHRDIKPDNILISGSHALVSDFGVAKAIREASPVGGATSTGIAIGTPAYMAPEQLAADPAADHRVDIYAVGLLAYELLTGRSPFSGQSPQATLAAQLTKMPDPPHLVAAMPEGLSALIVRCLAKDAADRPASAKALLAELDHFISQGGLPDGPADASHRRRPTVAGILVGAAVILALALMLRQRTPPPLTIPSPTDSLRATDIGPGGSRSTSLKVAPPNRVETVVVYREASDSAKGAPIPVIITRAESLAIAAAMRPRTSGRGDSARAIDRVMLLEEIGKVLADSLAQAMGRLRADTAFTRSSRLTRSDSGAGTLRIAPRLAPVTDGRTRVVVASFTNTTGKRDLSRVGRGVAQFLRDKLPVDRYTVVDSAMTADASRTLRDPMAMAWSFRAHYVVSGVVMQRGDSLVLLTLFNDVRGGRFARAAESAAPMTAPTTAYTAALAHVTSWLDTALVTAQRERRSGTNGAVNRQR